jgi:hypothetical protein
MLLWRESMPTETVFVIIGIMAVFVTFSLLVEWVSRNY